MDKKKLLTYISFAVTSILVVVAFVTATTYLQLGVAVVLYPFIAYFAYRIFFISNKKTPIAALHIPMPLNKDKKHDSKIESSNPKREAAVITDIDKRAFLKLVGATGLSFFLFSLFNRRTEEFFGKSQNPGMSFLSNTQGNKINPSESQPLDGYIISEIEDGYVSYYGFTKTNGAWYIMKQDSADGSFRYVKGNKNFSSNWVSRENLNYDYFHKVFE